MTKPTSAKPDGARPGTEPFSEGATSRDVAGLTVENGADRIAFYGQTDITRDKPGLERARALLSFASAVVRALEADPDLPDAAPAPKPAGKAANPFS